MKITLLEEKETEQISSYSCILGENNSEDIIIIKDDDKYLFIFPYNYIEKYMNKYTEDEIFIRICEVPLKQKEKAIWKFPLRDRNGNEYAKFYPNEKIIETLKQYGKENNLQNLVDLINSTPMISL